MSASRPDEKVSSEIISSTLPLESPGNHDHPTGGAPAVIYEVTAVDTTPVVKVYVKSTASGTWRQWTSWQQAVDTTTRTQRTPGTSITLVAGDQIIVPCSGFYAVRLDLQSGTSATTVARTSEEFGVQDLLDILIHSASALDTNIIKHNGTEYTILRTVVELTATGNLLAASASAYNHIIDGEIILAAGEAADTFYINDGTINLFGGSSQKLPLSPDGSAGPVGYRFNNLKTGAVNRAIICTLTGGSNVVASFRYIQPTT